MTKKKVVRNLSALNRNMAISSAHLQVHYYSEALPATTRTLYRSFTPWQLGVKDLPKVHPTNLRSSVQKALKVPMSRHACNRLSFGLLVVVCVAGSERSIGG